MAFPGLAKRPVPILLQGLDQKQPKQTAVTGKLDIVQNFIATKGTGQGSYEFVPRPGVNAVSKTADSGTISAGSKLGTLGNQLVLLTGNAFYRKGSDKWHLVDSTYPRLSVAVAGIVSNSLASESADVAYCNGFLVAAAVVQTSGNSYQLVASVYDSSGIPVVSKVVDTISGGIMARVHAVACGTSVVVTYQKSTTNLITFTVTTSPVNIGSTISVTASAAVGIGTGGHLQAVGSSPTSVVIGYLSSASSTYHLVLMTPAGSITANVDTGIGGVPAFSFMANDWSTNEIFACWGGGALALSYTKFNASTLATVSTTTLDGAITQMTGVTGIRSGSSVTVLATTTIGTTGGKAFDTRVVKSTGSTVSTVYRGCSLASQALSANGTVYVQVLYRGAGQGTVFLVDAGASTPAIVGKALPDVAYTSGMGTLPNFVTGVDSSTWITGAVKNVADIATAGLVSAYTGAVALTWKLGDSALGRPVELNGLHIPGALPMLYDGGTLTEDGFPIAPEQSDTITTSAGGSMTPGATYFARYCYAWPDANGNITRSAPSIVPQGFTLGATGGNATFSLPTLRVTRKANVSIEVYLTPANGDGSAYFMATNPLSPVLNDPTVDRVSFNCSLDDASLEGGLPLYTDGGILDNISPPPCRVMTVHRGRLMAGGVADDVQAVWFSKDVSPGFGVSWNDGLVSRLNSTSQAITSLGSMDAYAVACTSSTTWASGDQYPDDTGTGGVLDFQQYSDSTGSSLTSRISRTDQGAILWAGSKGVWRLSRGLSWDYVGSPIEDDVTTFTPSAIIAVPGMNQVRVIGTRGGVSTVFVYESIFGTWGRWTYTAPTSLLVDATVWNGSVAYLCADGTVLTEDTTTYDDLSTPASVSHQLQVSALNLAGVGGYKRVYATQITGRVLGTGGFTLRALQTIDSVTQTAKTKTIGASDVQLDAEVDPGPNGKCSDYALLISDSGNGANTAFSLGAFTLLIGIKAGLDKLPPSDRMT